MPIKHEMDAETFALCERAARDAGKKTVEEWISLLVSDRVGHTPFVLPKKVGHTSKPAA